MTILGSYTPFQKKSKGGKLRFKSNVKEGGIDILGWACSDFGDCTTFMALVEKLPASGSNILEKEVLLRI